MIIFSIKIGSLQRELFINSIEHGEVSPSILEDIAAYALFRLSLAKKEQK